MTSILGRPDLGGTALHRAGLRRTLLRRAVVRRAVVVLAVAASATGCAAESATRTTPPPAPGDSRSQFPEPAPDGPVRPTEPDVEGPDNVDALDMMVRSDGGAPDGVEVIFDRTSRTATGEKPAAARRFVFLFDRSVRFHPEAFPTCERAVIENHGVAGCPVGSRVGSGRAENYPHGSAEVAVFNTRYANGMRGVLITLPATGIVLENTFEPLTDSYRGEFTWGSDEILPPSPVPPAQRSATSRFQVSFGAVRRDGDQVHSFVRSFAAPGEPLRFGQWSEFVTGQVVRTGDEVPRP